MKSAPTLKSALENIDKALTRLEGAVDRKNQSAKRAQEEPQLDLSARNEREVNRKIAAKLDQTINRLETLLSDDAQ